MKIAVIGIGRMGAWFASLFAKQYSVAVYDVDTSKTKALQESSKCQVLDKLEALQSFQPDLLVNAVELQNTVAVFKVLDAYLPKDCIVSDVASIKGEIPSYYQTCPYRFVSIHPMFGPTFADKAHLKGENAVILKESNPEGAAFFRDFFETLGIKVIEYSAIEHDDMMAYSLTLPFVSSMVFTSCMDDKAVPGTTFKKHRQIAQGLMSEDDRLLSEILFNPKSITQIEKVTARLEFLKHIIRARDYEEAKRFFAQLRENI